mgnify:CR=1 FL=1
MNYSETITYLYSRLPMFTKIGASAIKKDLTNTISFCRTLGDPQKKFKSIHVGGTNGKGSTSHMLAAILQKAGYKTGLYTSPHLRDFRERIRVNGEMISEEQVVEFVGTRKQTIETIEPSFFEVTVAMAFDHFANEEVDIAVIEVGLGGRLDSTNIITPLLSVITNIGLDHVNLLGDTLPKIAFEKAGIIKPGIPVVIGEKQKEVANVFLEKARQVGSPISFASERWDISLLEDKGVQSQELELLHLEATSKEMNGTLSLSLDLTGIYQLKNVKTVLEAVERLREQKFRIAADDVRSALSEVKNLTGLMGRWQVLGTDPLTICDTGHNEDGIKEVVKNLSSQKYDKLHMIIGMVKDKEIGKVLKLLPKDASYYFCQPDLERAKPYLELLLEARAEGLQGEGFPTVKSALEAARKAAGSGDLIFIGGSTFVVAEVV